MELTICQNGVERDLFIRPNAATVNVGEILESLGLSRDSSLTTEGRRLALDAEFTHCGLVRGSVLELSDSSPDQQGTREGQLELCVIGGLEAGHSHPLADGQLVVGRAAGCDIRLGALTVSRRHCIINVAGASVVLSDAGGNAGTLVDGAPLPQGTHSRTANGSVVTVGTVQFVIRPSRTSDRALSVDPVRFATVGGEVPFNRPPRPAGPAGPAAVEVPRSPKIVAKTPFNVITVMGPAVAAVVMAVAFKNPLFALMAIMSPVMGAISWWDSRRHANKTTGAAGRVYRAALASFADQLAEQSAIERKTRHTVAPDIAEIVRRITLPSTRLWERRPNHPDFLTLTTGNGHVRWAPELAGADFEGLPSEVAATIESHSTLVDAPLMVALASNGPIGLVGPRAQTLPVARSLVIQAAALHGPSDVELAVLADTAEAEDWEWAKWLPHIRDLRAGDTRRLFKGVEACSGYLRDLLRTGSGRDGSSDSDTSDSTLLLVVDAAVLSRRRDPQFRDALRGNKIRSTGIVIVESEDLLPDVCSTVIVMDKDFPGSGRFTRPQAGIAVEDVIVSGVSEVVARSCGRRLARYDDPDIGVAGSDIPRRIPITGLLDIPSFDAEIVKGKMGSIQVLVTILAHSNPLAKPPLATAIGRSDDGVVTLDIVNDGPHGLIGGTSGAGKTELLRGLVLGLALEAGPEYLTFFFIDYKGAAGFGALSRLPHCVGLATNLSPDLSARALEALQSELDFRLRKFRQSPGKVEELHQYWMVNHEPLPRLVVVIDELAELKDALPDFVATLVRIGRIGRTLGVHLVTATQRPAEVVKGDLKENSNFSIALRITDPANSVDLIGTSDAAKIPPKGYQGRALLRLGGNMGPPPILFQSPLSSGRTSEQQIRPVDVLPFRFGPACPDSGAAEATDDSHGDQMSSDLERLVDATIQAAAGIEPPRRPWTDPLPAQVSLDEIQSTCESDPQRNSEFFFALADDVARQCRRSIGWDTDGGNLLVFGILGSGTTTALRTLVAAILGQRGSTDAHIYLLDCGSGELRDLELLPGVGAVITANESERQIRVVRYLLEELRERKARPASSDSPTIFLLIDNFGRLVSGETPAEVIEGVARLFTEGPDVGMLTAATADRLGAISTRLADLAPQKLALRLADKSDYSAFSVAKRDPADMPPGRAVMAGSGLSVQIGIADLDQLQRHLNESGVRSGALLPKRIEVLPTVVTSSELAQSVIVEDARWFIPVGRGSTTLDIVGWSLRRGDHALVVGPPRAGKSSFLVSLAEVMRQDHPGIFIGALVPKETSPLTTSRHCDAIVNSEEDLVSEFKTAAAASAHLIIVDDAHLVADAGGLLESAISESDATTHFIVAGRGEDLKGLYQHWTQSIRKCRTGLILRVSQTMDGDLIGARLPMIRSYDTRPGRGYIAIDGDTELVQVPLAGAS